MADIISDGNTRVFWVTSISNISLPTAAELIAGLLLHSTMTPDGLSGFQPTTNRVPNRKLDSRFNTVDTGSVDYSNTELRFYKQTGTDTIFDTLVYGTAGFLAVRRSMLASTTWIAGQKPVEIYPAKCGELARMDYEPDTEERYAIPLMITSQPVLRAVVA